MKENNNSIIQAQHVDLERFLYERADESKKHLEHYLENELSERDERGELKYETEEQKRRNRPVVNLEQEQYMRLDTSRDGGPCQFILVHVDGRTELLDDPGDGEYDRMRLFQKYVGDFETATIIHGPNMRVAAIVGETGLIDGTPMNRKLSDFAGPVILSSESDEDLEGFKPSLAELWVRVLADTPLLTPEEAEAKRPSQEDMVRVISFRTEDEFLEELIGPKATEARSMIGYFRKL